MRVAVRNNKLFLVLCFLLALYFFYCVRVKKSFPFQIGNKGANYQLFFFLPNSRAATDWYAVPKELYDAVDINGCITIIDRRIISNKQEQKYQKRDILKDASL